MACDMDVKITILFTYSVRPTFDFQILISWPKHILFYYQQTVGKQVLSTCIIVVPDIHHCIKCLSSKLVSFHFEPQLVSHLSMKPVKYRHGYYLSSRCELFQSIQMQIRCVHLEMRSMLQRHTTMLEHERNSELCQKARKFLSKKTLWHTESDVACCLLFYLQM